MGKRTSTTLVARRAPTSMAGLTPALVLSLGLVFGLGLTGCGSTAPAAPASPITSPATPVGTSPTSVSDGAPVMPEVARQHTKAGAKAFVTYFWQVVDYATAELEPDALTPLVRADCSGCTAGIDFITDAQKRAATIRGGTEHVESLTARRVSLGDDEYFSVEVRISNTEQHVRYSDGASKTFPASTVRDHLMLQPTTTGWVVASLEAA